MTRTVKDAALMLQVIAGYDPEDTSSTNMAVPDYAGTLAARGSALRIGIPRAHFYEGLHPEIQATMNTALSTLGKLTANQSEVGIPVSNDAVDLIIKAEAYTYHREYITKTPELYQAETLKRIQRGAEVSMAAYVYGRRQLDQFRRSVHKVFDAADLLVTPTTPVPPFTISELLADLENLFTKELLTLRNTPPFNLLGLPTVSVPCGFTSNGLPIGMQITGPPWSEATVLRLAYVYEQATDWHDRKPNLG